MRPGIAEMSGEFEGEPQKIMVSLDAVGNTTKAITKGVAIGSAVIAAVALFAAFIQTIGEQLNIHATGNQLFQQVATEINVANPKTFIGMLIGGSIAFLASSFLIRAVGRSAGTVVEEVRKQFREHPGIMTTKRSPSTAVSWTSARKLLCVSWRPPLCWPCSCRWSSGSASGT